MKSLLIWKCSTIVFLVIGLGIVFGQAYNKSAETKIKGPDSANSNIPSNSLGQPIGMIDSQDTFDKELLILRRLRETGTLEDVLAEGDKIEKQWGTAGGNPYGELFLEFLRVLSSRRYADKVGVRCRALAIHALAKADTYDLDFEWHFLLFLGVIDANSENLSDGEILQRSLGTKLWLHAIMRLEGLKDANFNPDDLPFLSVSPPDGSGYPAGVAPEAITNSKIRATYEKAIAANTKKMLYFNEQLAILRQEKFFVIQGVDYIARAYSVGPTNITELEALLDAFRVSSPVRKSIGERRKDFESERKRMQDLEFN